MPDTLRAVFVMAVIGAVAVSGCHRQSPSGESADPKAPWFFLEFKGDEGCKLSATLNGYPVLRAEVVDAFMGAFVDMTLGLKNGRNCLVLSAEASPERPSGSVTFEVTARRPIKTATVLKVISRGSHKFDEKAPAAFKKTLYFDVAMPFEWTWESAEVVDVLSPTDRAEILGTVKGLHSAWAAGDIDACVGVYAMYVQDWAKYLHWSEESLRAEMRKLYRGLLEEPGARVVMKKADSLVLTPYGKVVLVDSKDRSDGWIIRVEYPDRGGTRNRRVSIHKHFVFAKIKGKWRLVQ